MTRPEAGFGLNLHDLRRTPGSIKDFRVRASYDHEIRVGLIQVPPGREVVVTGTLQSVGDGVLVTAAATVTLDAQCARCLREFTTDDVVDVQELFVYPERVGDYGADETDDVQLIDDDLVDIGPAVRDAIILNQPVISLCRPDCAGLCPRCGADLNDDPGHDHAPDTDSRWLALAQWGKMS